MVKMWGIISFLLVGILLITAGLIAVRAAPIGETWAINGPKVIDIATTPTGTLFNLNNMKPGDWATQRFTIKNNENIDLVYTGKADFKSGNVTLYGKLLLNISHNNLILYEGKLSDFKTFAPRLLANFSEESLDFTIKFPEYLGNEYQGVSVLFNLDFISEN